MMRTTYVSNGSLERALKAARRRWWRGVLLNTTCMLLFTASMTMLAFLFMDRLG